MYLTPEFNYRSAVSDIVYLEAALGWHWKNKKSIT